MATTYTRAVITGPRAWSYFPLFPWLAYVLTGMGFRMITTRSERIRDFTDDSRILFIVIPLALVLILTLPWASSVTSHLYEKGGYYHHGIRFYGWATGFMIIYLLVVRQVEQSSRDHAFTRLLEWTGKHVTVVYVIQWLLIGNLATYFYQTLGLLGCMFWFAAIAVATGLISFGWTMIRR